MRNIQGSGLRMVDRAPVLVHLCLTFGHGTKDSQARHRWDAGVMSIFATLFPRLCWEQGFHSFSYDPEAEVQNERKNETSSKKLEVKQKIGSP